MYFIRQYLNFSHSILFICFHIALHLFSTPFLDQISVNRNQEAGQIETLSRAISNVEGLLSARKAKPRAKPSKFYFQHFLLAPKQHSSFILYPHFDFKSLTLKRDISVVILLIAVAPRPIATMDGAVSYFYFFISRSFFPFCWLDQIG